MVQKFKTLADVVALAEFAHRNQTDKAGEPYISHPKRVLATVQAQGVQPYVQMAAVLHDVTEDTAFTPQMLLDLGVSEAAVNLVRLLDRGYSAKKYHLSTTQAGSYKQYFGEIDSVKASEFYYEQIKANRDATIVKLADIRDNLSPWRLAYLDPETQERLQVKYAKALEILNPASPWQGSGMMTPHDPFYLR